MIALKPYIRMDLLKKGLFVVTLIWAGSSTYIAIMHQPKIVLIGLDDSGTRVITSVTDPLIAKERVRFIREFLRLYYRYDSADYSAAMSQAGALMSDLLWSGREAEYQKIADQMKTTPLAQDAELLDLREVSDQEFEADLKITVKSRLEQKQKKYRVGMKIAPRKRSADNPYPFELTEVHENELQ